MISISATSPITRLADPMNLNDLDGMLPGGLLPIGDALPNIGTKFGTIDGTDESL